MSCEHCADGRLMHNFYPQIEYDPEARDGKGEFRMFTLAKALINVDGELCWVEMHLPDMFGHDARGKREKEEFYRRLNAGPAVSPPPVKARYCPICGDELCRSR